MTFNVWLEIYFYSFSSSPPRAPSPAPTHVPPPSYGNYKLEKLKEQ